MLRDLLLALAESHGQSSAELRARLKISRELLEQLLAQLVRLGFVAIGSAAAEREASAQAKACPERLPGRRAPGCASCPVPCGNPQALAATSLRVTPKGLAFAQREAVRTLPT